jgi:glycerophosphoryl diester phosphodiesterase
MHIRLLLPLLLAACAAGAWSFDLQGHRGARGLAPENTLPGFERALAVGVTTLELDVGLTGDQVVIVSHDPALNPNLARDATGRWLAPGRALLLRSQKLAELQGWDVGRIRPDTPYAKTFAQQEPVDGTRMPTLASVFDLVRTRGGPVRLNIETKIDPTQPEATADPETFTRALLTTIRDAGMVDRVSIQSFDWRTLRRVQVLEPSIPTAYLTVQGAGNDNVRDGRWTAGFRLADHGSVPRMVKAAGGAVWSPNAASLTEELLREARSLGLKVIPWTVNEPDDMDRLVGWGVDGLITDYPDRLRTVLQRRGIPLPAPVRF